MINKSTDSDIPTLFSDKYFNTLMFNGFRGFQQKVINYGFQDFGE